MRAAKTVAQTAIATIGTAAAMGAVDWKNGMLRIVLGGDSVAVDEHCRHSGGERLIV